MSNIVKFESMESVLAKRFEVGQTYATPSICDSECIFSFKVISRTEKTITLDYHGEKIVRRPSIYRGAEHCLPLGSYSMAPSINAERDIVEED